MGERGSTQKERAKVIDYELDLIFNVFDMGGIERTRKEMYDLRCLANDLESIETIIIKNITDGSDISEDDEEFKSLVEVTIHSYYLMLHFTKMYLEMGDFEGLADIGFDVVWKKIDNHDKAKVIEMALVLGDTLAIVHGMYLLLAQIERDEKGV